METVRLLNRLEVNLDDVVDKDGWVGLLISVIRSTAGQESLSSYYWHLLDKLGPDSNLGGTFVSRDVGLMKSLEAEDWERLEVWMWILWRSLGFFDRPRYESMRDVEQTNLKLLLRRRLAIPRFEDLYRVGALQGDDKVTIRQICDRARGEQTPSETPIPL